VETQKEGPIGLGMGLFVNSMESFTPYGGGGGRFGYPGILPKKNTCEPKPKWGGLAPLPPKPEKQFGEFGGPLLNSEKGPVGGGVLPGDARGPLLSFQLCTPLQASTWISLKNYRSHG